MQSFTKIEISWIATELDKLATAFKNQSAEAPDQAFSQMYQLRSEQYADISRRLRVALKEGNKRIEIK